MNATCELTEQDVRAMVRLLGEVASLQADHATCKRELMNGLCRLIQGDCWVWALMCQPGDGRPQVYTSMLHDGFDSDRLNRLMEANDHPEMSWVARRFFEELQQRGKHITRARHQIISDDDFSRTQAFEGWTRADIGSLILSMVPLEGESGSFVGIYRRSQAPAFTERECRIAHIVLSEVTWLHGQGWPEDRGVTVPQLSPRQRNVLNWLIMGYDRKKIADLMGISPNTVAGYTKEIYRHFGVNTQAALQARFFSGDGGDRI
ncbi:MAG: helix-turn-helix transcriptional regulator [Candidatus Methylacidiphilales bacterium]